jgi:hypothetical protein
LNTIGFSFFYDCLVIILYVIKNETFKNAFSTLNFTTIFNTTMMLLKEYFNLVYIVDKFLKKL